MILHAGRLLGYLLIAFATAPASACESWQGELRLASAETLQLQLAPSSEYVGWIEEQGVDISLLVEGRVVDSLPGPWAREPLRARSDAEGHLRLTLPAARVETPIAVRLQCWSRLRPLQQDAWRRLLDAATALTQYLNHREPSQGARAMWALIRAQMAPQAPTQRLWLQQQWAGLARAAGRPAEAAVAYAGIEKEHAAIARPQDLALALLSEGQMRLAIQDPLAEPRLASARQALLDADLPNLAAIAEQDRCLSLRLLNDITSIDCLQRSAQRFSALGLRHEQVNAQRNQANALLMFGRSAEARKVLQDAAELTNQLGDRQSSAMLWLLQARLASSAAEFELALQLLDRASDAFDQRNDMLWHAQAQRLIGDVYSLSGDAARALSYYRRAGDSYRRRGMNSKLTSVQLTEARTLERLNRNADAVALAQQVHDRVQDGATLAERAAARLGLAEHLFAAGHAESAARLLQPEAELEASWTAQQRARIDLLSTRLQGAAAPAALQARLQLAAQRALADGQLLIYLNTSRVLAELEWSKGEADRASQRVEQVAAQLLPVAAAIRSPGLRIALLDGLREMLLLDLPTADQVLDLPRAERWMHGLERLRRVARQSAAIEQAGDSLTALERSVGEALLSDELERPSLRRDQSHLALLRQLQAEPTTRAGSDTTSLSRPSSDALWAQPLLTQRTAGWLLHDHRGWRWLQLGQRAELPLAIADLRSELAAGHADAERLQRQIAALQLSLRWNDVLEGAGQRVYLMAEPWIAALPLEWMLELADQPAQTDLIWLQSLSQLAPLQPGSLSLLATADSQQQSLPGLSAAAAELDAVRQQWSALPVQQARPASIEDLLRALQISGGLVHVAAHGVAALRLEEESGLWLQHAGSNEPQFVSAVRLRAADVHSGLIVLSACETGYSGAQRNFGMGGVAGSLIDAGAQRVIGTRWPVGDRVAREFSTALHAALAANGGLPEQAVREAREALRQRPAFRHPGNWAGWFVLQAGPQTRANSLDRSFATAD